ncbi:MAG: hypothetical protein ACI4DP_12670 [Candidatus Ornithomonoglobus sp.]
MNEKPFIDVGTCPVNASHETTACVSVSICPFADPEPISVENCGAPVVKCGGEPCCGVVNGRFEFTVAQKMKINVPIVFGADIAVGTAYIHNGQTTACINGDCSTCSGSERERECECEKEKDHDGEKECEKEKDHDKEKECEKEKDHDGEKECEKEKDHDGEKECEKEKDHDGEKECEKEKEYGDKDYE